MNVDRHTCIASKETPELLTALTQVPRKRIIISVPSLLPEGNDGVEG